MNGLQQVIYDASRVLLWPVLIAALVCLFWVLIELGFFLYELYLRFRYRDLDALEARTLRARRAFQDGKPRTAYRYLQENNYSIVVARFLFDLIRNYQTERLAAKPLKLLQEYEFYTVKRLERTRILVRVGPILGLMGTLIPLAPALLGLASGNTTQFAEDLTTAFSVTVIGLLIGGIAYVISIVRDRLYSQDISDMEYLLELLEGGDERLQSGRRRNKRGVWDADPVVVYEAAAADVENTVAIPVLLETPREPLIPFASDERGEAPLVAEPAVPATPIPAAPAGEAPPLSFDDPAMDWQRDEDPFADLGPVDSSPPAGGASAPGAGAPPTRR
ncbi:MAG: MotA/TolQ/ExbB proton channel family protein [Actinobacteria bacterium]|nr:MotA/TolQ/ExbB proton channel family protein [Actinomycetota bacterium]